MTDKCCDVCGRANELSLVSSRLAPVTYAICSSCADRGAENIGVLAFWVASYGGLGFAPDFARQLVSWIDGKYVGWQQISSYFLENETDIRRAFEEEFFLVDDDQ